MENDYSIYETKKEKIISIFDKLNKHLEKRKKLSDSHIKIAIETYSSKSMDELIKWDYWVDRIPYINFDEDMSVSIEPPFCEELVRFFVRSKAKEYDRIATVYLDFYKTSEPYWEVYPNSARHYDESCGIVRFDDIDGLLELIRKASH